jgi:hypothetical protein
MDKFTKQIDALSKTLEVLKEHKDFKPVAPMRGCFYKTLNGSYVYCFKLDSDGDGRMVVLKGGHDVSTKSGEEPGETYYVDEEGYYKSEEVGAWTLMSLAEKLSIILP